jgi:lipopolysaccharide export system permease protein
VLFLIMGYRMPGFLQLILPLGLFLGILLAYGRLYLESEMSVLSAAGMSRQRLLAYSLAPATLVALLVAWLSLSLAPLGVSSAERILNSQDALTEFDTLVPGRFQALKSGSRVTYTERLSEDGRELGGVFITELRLSRDGDKQRGISLLVAEKGRQEIRADGSRYLILENGYRYDGKPGQADYRAIQYDRYGVLLPKPEVAGELTERDGIPTTELISGARLQQIPEKWRREREALRYQSELQWRLSLPLLAFVVTVLAVPLSRVNPRQGRFLKLIAMRGQLDKGRIPPALGLWWVHGLFLAIGLLLLYWEPLRLKWAARRVDKEVLRAQA